MVIAFVLALVPAVAQAVFDGRVEATRDLAWTCSSQTQPVRTVETGSVVTWEWGCLAGHVLRCDAPGQEPRDFAASECNGRLVSQPANTVTLDWRDEASATVEWRELGSTGTRLLASRVLTGRQPQVPVARAPRILRVHRPGAAPVSLYVPGVADAVVRVPAPEPGGEVAWLPAAGVGSPVAVALAGLTAARIELPPAASFTRQAQFAGTVDARLVFSSQLTTERVPLEIVDGATVEVGRGNFEAMSELTLVGEPGLEQHAPTSLQLNRLDEADGSMSRQPVWRSAVQASSESMAWVVDGLPEGTYEAVLTGDQPIASTVVELPANQRVQAPLATPNVEVFGEVTLAGAVPPEGTRIHFEFDKQRFSTTTGPGGTYRVRAGTPGRYTARLEAAKYFWTWTDHVNFVEGANRFDWKIPGGSLRLRLRRDDGQAIDEVVQLQCRARGFHAAGPIMRDEVAHPVLIAGLPLDEITCSADTKSGLVSNELLVRLSSNTPSIDTALSLRMLAGMVELRSTGGATIPGARITVGNMTLDEEPVGSGLYKLLRAIPGSGVLIQAPGHLPMCRALREADYPLVRWTLVPAGSVPFIIRLTPRATRPPGRLFGLPGSECPVNLFALEPGLRNSGTASTEIRLMLPPGTYQYQPYALFPLQTFSVPGPPLELTRPK